MIEVYEKPIFTKSKVLGKECGGRFEE